MRWPYLLLGVGVLVACSAGSDDGSSVGGGASSGTGAKGGNGGNGGNGGGIIITDGGGNGGNGGSLGDAACATQVYNGERLPLDMYIVFDRSGSMSTQTASGTLWEATKQAFLTFIQSPTTAGIGVGLQFFPPGQSSGSNCFGVPPCASGCIDFAGFCVPGGDEGCLPSDYLPPSVFIEQLPGVAPKVTAALNGTSPGGGTPTTPAMKAAGQAVTSYAAQNPTRKVIIVLATDGNPNDCNSDIASVSAVAKAAAASSPPVSTFVIGINNSGVNTSGLDQIAAAGGTTKALIVDPAKAGAEFLAAIQAIQGQALGCTFKMPPPPAGETINPNQVNVWYTPSAGSPELIYKVPNAAGCDPTLGGWYYPNPQNPQEVELCPTSCSKIEGTKGEVRIELGCATVEIPK
ncbi:MAG: VWA domain-containing protein [Polyangiaceae bacterium]